MIKVVIVDDHQLVRSGVRVLLSSDPEIEVVGEATNGQEGVEAAVSAAADVVLMDLSMPVMDGVEATAALVERLPDAKVLVLTSFADSERVRAALGAGATGYVLKDAEPDQLLSAVKSAAAGHVPIDPRVARALLPNAGGSSSSPGANLSARETEVLRLVAQGFSNKQIGRALGIAERTVKAHLGRVFRELGVLDRTSAALWAKDHLD
ncbi:MAG: response regulator transcription factor [Nocardioides sp.]